MTIKDTIEKQIEQVAAYKYDVTDFKFSVEYPRDEKYGDYSTNVAMVLSKQLGKNPTDIGDEIAGEFKEVEMFDNIRVVKPGFINFYLSKEYLIEKLKEIVDLKDKYGESEIGKGKNIVIDYSAPNIAKKMHVGHLRSTVIGAAIYNIYRRLGYEIVRDNHLGDWGTQFGKLIYEYKDRYGEEIKKDITVDELEEMYINFHEKLKEKPEMEEGARQELKKLQDKDKFNYKLWKLFYDISLDEFKRVYEKLGIGFDVWHGESFYHEMLERIVKDALEKQVAKKSEGAVVIPLEKDGLPDFLIQKSDGAYLYSTTDLATVKYRRKEYKSVKDIYVVANQQTLHLEQAFKSAKLLGLYDKEEMVHVKFGLILGKDGKKMSTRDGEVVDLMDLIKIGTEKAKEKILEKNKDLKGDELQKIAEIVALGAIKYNDLSQNRLTDIRFDWDKMLSFNSESSPYLQYTYVRINSIFKKLDLRLEKYGDKKVDYGLLGENMEIEIVRILVKFQEVIVEAAEQYRPNLICLYLEGLAKNFHVFYEELTVMGAEDKLKQARLALIGEVAMVIKTGLDLLGIDVPEKM